MLVVCSLLALTLAQPPAAAEQGGRITGRVVLQGANTPVSGARVILVSTSRPVGPIAPPAQTTSDQDGRFRFDGVSPGTYRVDAQKAGFAPPDDASRNQAFSVVEGQSTDVIVRVQKGAAITGKVVDPTGEPLADARVVVLRRTPMPARAGRGLPPMPRLVPVPSPGSQTNDLGEFRVSGLAPGEYFIAVSPRSVAMFGTAGSSPARDRKMARTTLPTTYYPGTSDQAAAQPIAVAAGAEVGNINFAMQPVPAFRVSGVVVDEEGKPVGGAMVMLMADPSIGLMGPVGNSMSQPNGRFDIDDVPAGTYRVNASIMMRMAESGGGSGNSGGAVTWSSSSISGRGAIPQPLQIVVADADVTGVQVVARRPNPR